MKKIYLFGLALFAGLSAFAQIDVVKEVERELKGGNPDFDAIREKITPALTHPETQNDAKAWYLAGKNEFEQYDNLFGLKTIGREVDGKVIGNALINGYDKYMAALPLDSVADKKGKIKTKYSKDIVKDVVGHFNDFDNAARFLWDAQDYMGAYKAWDIFINMPHNKSLGKDAPQAYADTLISEIMYNQALAAWQGDQLELALAAFDRAKNHGYNKKQLYDYAISVAVQLQKMDVVYALSEAAMPLYGSEDPKYLQLIINSYIESKDYAKAQEMLDKAIAQEPNNAQYYNVMGVLYESQNNNAKALECYKKAVELDGTIANAQYNYGRQVYQRAYEIQEEGTKLTTAEYNKLQENEILPLLRQAASILEEAYSIDDAQRDALQYLRQIYYMLQDEANLKRIENLLKY